MTETEPAGTSVTDVPQSDETATAEQGALPLEVVLEGARFGLDRPVPVDPAGLRQVGEDDGVLLFAIAGGPPFDRLYGAADIAVGRPGRYLAEQPVGPDGVPSPEGTCLSETANFTMLEVGDARYVYAGPEPDLTMDQLQVVLQTGEDQPVYAETTAEPFPELYFESDGTLNRFILLDDRGVPQTIGETIVFAGQTFAFDRDATGEADPNALSRVGCVGPFSARADAGRRRESGPALCRPQRHHAATAGLHHGGAGRRTGNGRAGSTSRPNRGARPGADRDASASDGNT